MATLDIILLLLFIPAAISGVIKGFVRQCVSVIALIAGIWAAFRFSAPVEEWLSGFFTLEHNVMRILSFAGVAILAALLLNLAGGLVSKALDSLSLGWIDRILGLALGILKTALVLGLLIFLFENLNASWNMTSPDSFSGSVLYPALRDFTTEVLPFIKDLVTNLPSELTNV